MGASQYLNSVERRLTDSRFKVAREVALSDSRTARLAASRTKFSWKCLAVLSQHVIVVEMGQPEVADVRRLLDAGFEYAKKVDKVPLLRGFYMIVPCIVSSGVSPEVIDLVTAQRAKLRRRWSGSGWRRWSLLELPVAHDLATGGTHYFTGRRSAWGLVFFKDLRSLAADHLESETAQPQ